MKTRLFPLAFILLLLSLTAISQNVTIQPSGISPTQFNNYPRISNDQILALSNPQKGDLANDLTFNCLRVYNGAKWLQLLTAQDLGQTATIAWKLVSNQTLGANGICKDSHDNIFVAGNFKGNAVFGSTNINAIGDNDIFVAKYTSEGVLLWVKTGGSMAGDICTDIVVDLNGNVIITGYFFDAINFDGNILTNSGQSDVFVVKYNTSGNLLWAKKAGGTNQDICNSVEVDTDGNIYLGGYYSGTSVFFGSPNIMVNSTGGEDAFVAKLNAVGDVIWVQNISGTASQRTNDIMIMGTELIVMGTFENLTNFGNAISTNTSVGNVDIFIAKYNASGTCQSAISFGGNGTDEASRLTHDNNSNIWACGSIYQNATIGSYNLTSAGSYDAFFVILNSSLTLLNAKLIGGPSIDKGNDLGIDAEGNVFLVGEFSENISNGVKTVNSNGGSDIFLSKFTDSGFPLLLQNFGGTEFDSAKRMVVGSNLFITGVFSQTVNLGTILTSSGTPLNGYVLRVSE